MLIKKKRKVDSFNLFNPFSTNVPLMHKPGSWFLLGKHLRKSDIETPMVKNELSGIGG